MTISRRLFLSGSTACIAAASLAAAPGASPPSRAPVRRAGARVRTRDGAELYVKDWGSGPPVVFIHGWPFSADMWDHQASVLADAGHRVITYDRRGFGRSSQPSSGYDFDTLADDLAAVIQETGVRDVTLVGYSMGGGEIVRYLSRHGARKVARLALVGTIVPGLLRSKSNPNGIEGAVFDGIKAGLNKDKATFLATLLKDVIYDAGIRGTNPVTREILDWSFQMAMQAGLRPLVACVDAFGRTDFRPELSAVTVPTLILHGTADKPVPFGITARAAAAGIRGARLIEYRGTSHGLHVTERDRVTRDLMSFLAA